MYIKHDILSSFSYTDHTIPMSFGQIFLLKLFHGWWVEQLGELKSCYKEI